MELNEKELKKEKIILDFILNIIVFIIVTLYTGFVIMWLFNRFVANTFSINEINVFQAVGIDLLFTLLTPKKINENNQKFLISVAHGVTAASLYLLLGWIVSLFL